MTFNKLYKLISESNNISILTEHTSFKSIKNINKLRVYRSSARSSKTKYDSGSHVGTKQQALIRADYMINDEEKYDHYFLYELVLEWDKIYPNLLTDNGSDHGLNYADTFKDYDILFYKNTGEGNIKNENLSAIIVNPNVITHSNIIQKLNSEYLLSIYDELYY